MRVTLNLVDGSEQIHNAQGVSISLGDWTVEIKPEPESHRLHFHVPAHAEAACNFVVHHRCANTMSLEITPIPRVKDQG
jgi:hypothetical protein